MKKIIIRKHEDHYIKNHIGAATGRIPESLQRHKPPE